MRIAVFGAGGVGGYFGGRLAAAGEDVWFIARGRHLEAMRAEGTIDERQAELFLSRAEALCQAQSGQANTPALPGQ